MAAISALDTLAALDYSLEVPVWVAYLFVFFFLFFSIPVIFRFFKQTFCVR